MAASGDAHIGFVSTVRHPDFVMHWRLNSHGFNQFGYKMKDFARGCMWTANELSPVRNGAKYDVCDQQTLLKWLPEPGELADWTMAQLGSH